MKNLTRKDLKSHRPNHSPRHCIEHALNALFDDNTKRLDDEVVKNLTYEELIGALLLARDYAPQSVRLSDIEPNN